jgi:hypothetical protein
MKKVLAIMLGLVCATSLTVLAAGGGAKATPRSEDQEKVWKEILTKYGKPDATTLDKTEQSKISKDDADKLTKAGLTKAGRVAKKKATTP